MPDVLHIIPLKMRAHIDLNRSREGGEQAWKKNRTKHRADVLSLADLLTEGASCNLPAAIADDAREFIEGLEEYVLAVQRKQRPRIMETMRFLTEVYGL